MEVIVSGHAPAAIGPYSQGIVTGNLLFTSGQLPIDPHSGETPQGIIAQAEQSCINVGNLLDEAGSSYDRVVKTTCYLVDMNDFPQFNEVYARYFTGNPARSCVAVKELPTGALCEIECVAERDA